MTSQWRELHKRITGFSTPIFGVSWDPPENQRAICRELVAFLEDRRVLYNPHEAEVPQHCVESIIRIREKLTEIVSRAPESSPLDIASRQMRVACRDFLDRGGREEVLQNGVSFGHWASWIFLPALGELRARIGTQLAVLCAAYGVEPEAGLATILPPPLDEDGA